MTIAIGSDHAGFQLKEEVVRHLRESGKTYRDMGVFDEKSADYPDIAAAVVEAVAADECFCGILICGTGIGMSIAANKRSGIRAAMCGDPYSARCAREHNDANILTMGSRVIGPGLAVAIVEVFLNTSFTGGRHSSRLEKIVKMERR